MSFPNPLPFANVSKRMSNEARATKARLVKQAEDDARNSDFFKTAMDKILTQVAEAVHLRANEGETFMSYCVGHALIPIGCKQLVLQALAAALSERGFSLSVPNAYSWENSNILTIGWDDQAGAR